MTIDKLAVMVANGFENMATKEDLENLKKIMATKTDIKGLKDQIENVEKELKGRIAGVDRRIDDIAINRVKYEDHDKLKARVDFIEKKLEIKK